MLSSSAEPQLAVTRSSALFSSHRERDSPVHATIERKVLTFPNLIGSAISGYSIPGPSVEGSVVTSSNDALQAGFARAWDLAARRIEVPADTVAIGIAPDSSLAMCDIAIGGRAGERERHRISPGNPYIGCPGADHAYITIPNCPALYAHAPLYEVAADAVVLETGGSKFASWPLRLEVMRGTTVPMRQVQRAPMVANAYFEDVDTTEASGVRGLLACVDGRRRLDVALYSTGGTTTFRAYAQEPVRSTNAYDAAIDTQLELDDAGAVTVAVTTGTQAIISFYGNPMTVLRVTGTVGASNTSFQIRVRAWDD